MQNKKLKDVLVVGVTYKDGSYLLVESQSYEIALKLKEKLNVFYFDPDVSFSENVQDIEAFFNSESKVNGDILLLNCSRDVEKLVMVKKIINNKRLNYFEFHIWE